jgi:pimeloyl-ACP methyl ester carboxylesterase
MIASLSKLIDWSALQVMSMRRPLDNKRSPRLEEALQLLKGLNFIPAESQPARVEFGDPLHFRFPSPRASKFAENNVVYGRLHCCAERWQERPVIVLLHGGGGLAFLGYRFRFPLIVRRCNQAGFNVATLESPYHLQRRPRQPGALSQLDFLRDAEAAAQAVAEIRAFTGWLLGKGCPAVALWGSSYGGWLAGLTVCHDARLAAVVLTVPGVRSNCSIAERIIWRRTREALQRQGVAREALNLTSWNLTTTQPVILKENILLIEAVHDLFATKESIEELWQSWEHPEIWRVPHGHFSFSLIGAPCMMADRVLRWLSPRLNLQPQLQSVHSASP